MSNPFNTVINPNVPKMNPNDAYMYLMKPLLYRPQVVLRRNSNFYLLINLNVTTNVFQINRTVYKPQLSKMSEEYFGIEYNNRIFVYRIYVRK